VALPTPPGVVIATLTAPAACAGVVAVIVDASTTVTPVAAVPPKVTDDALVRLVPVMVTEVPPAVEPLLGETEVTVGAGMKVYWSAVPVALVPPDVVTVISTVAAPTGEVALIELAVLTVNEAAAVEPNFTAVAPVKSVPVMVTMVPPAAGPEVGEILVTVGGGVT